MKKVFGWLFVCILLFIMPGCSRGAESADVVATTKPVYDFTVYLCKNTDIQVNRLITESVSCLHDYTLQVNQMRSIESAKLVVISGAGLEDFLHDALETANCIVDSSQGIDLQCVKHSHHDHGDHHHETDPHIWLSTENAGKMAENICAGLSLQFPQYSETFQKNLSDLQIELNQLQNYGKNALHDLSSRDIITFHDGFSYFADEWDLNIVHSLEEESGSEASAMELKELINLVRQYDMPAIFTEENGSTSAAEIIANETNIPIFNLNMGMSDLDYFEIMYQNINTIKEALE